jgi:hypothetical protein
MKYHIKFEFEIDEELCREFKGELSKILDRELDWDLWSQLHIILFKEITTRQLHLTGIENS